MLSWLSKAARNYTVNLWRDESQTSNIARTMIDNVKPWIGEFFLNIYIKFFSFVALFLLGL